MFGNSVPTNLPPTWQENLRYGNIVCVHLVIPKSKEQVREHTLIPRATPSAWNQPGQSLAPTLCLGSKFSGGMSSFSSMRGPWETVTSLVLKPGKDQGPKSRSQKVLVFWGNFLAVQRLGLSCLLWQPGLVSIHGGGLNPASCSARPKYIYIHILLVPVQNDWI